MKARSAMSTKLPDSIHRLLYNVRTYSWLVDPRRFRELPDYPIDRPVFLLGTQGGGLTLLSRMLRRHPSVVSAAGNSSYWTSADELQNVYGLILPAELTGLRYKVPPHPTFPNRRSWTYASRDLFPIYRKTAADYSPALQNVLKRTIRLCLARHARDPQAARFIDKSQVFTVKVGLISALLSEETPRFVLVTRDPYPAVYRAASGKAADMQVLAAHLSIEERLDICAEHYGNSMRAVFDDCDSLALSLHVLRFEDLVKNTKDMLEEVCSFADIGFSTNMIPSPEQKLPIGSRYLERWYPLVEEPNGPYEGFVNDDVISAVNRHMDDVLHRMGYDKR